MGRIVPAALIAAVVVFAWGFIAHTAVNLFKVNSFRSAPAIAELMKQDGAEDGVYVIPSMPRDFSDEDASDTKEHKRRHEAGPIAVVFFHRDGDAVMPPAMFAKGFAVSFVACLLLAMLLSMLKLPGFGRRFCVCATVGAMIALHVDASNWVWYRYATDWTIASAIYNLVSWAAAGLVLAAMVKPAR